MKNLIPILILLPFLTGCEWLARMTEQERRALIAAELAELAGAGGYVPVTADGVTAAEMISGGGGVIAPGLAGAGIGAAIVAAADREPGADAFVASDFGPIGMPAAASPAAP